LLRCQPSGAPNGAKWQTEPAPGAESDSPSGLDERGSERPEQEGQSGLRTWEAPTGPNREGGAVVR